MIRVLYYRCFSKNQVFITLSSFLKAIFLIFYNFDNIERFFIPLNSSVLSKKSILALEKSFTLPNFL